MQQGAIVSAGFRHCHCCLCVFRRICRQLVQSLEMALLFWSQGQQAFPVTTVQPSIVQNILEGGEGTPSPMLSISGLSLEELEPHIAKMNRHLPSISQFFVSLDNGPKAFIITGPSKALFRLVTTLQKTKAPSCLVLGLGPF